VLSEKERCKRILDAAERVFTTDGYGAATMEEVARVAGMSKKTIYKLFPDKEHLFAALISDVDAFPGGKTKRRVGAPDPVADLRDHLLSLAQFVLSPRQVALTRLLISEARHSPKLADEFYARVMRKGIAHLTDGVARALQTKGATEIDNIESVAMALFGAALGGLHLGALFGKQENVPRKQLIAQIDLAIGLVLPNLIQGSDPTTQTGNPKLYGQAEKEHGSSRRDVARRRGNSPTDAKKPDEVKDV
jgi:AcrR family transcriptional regulator